ncbi:hypothetical protein B0J11DRAFT_584301 [Dendryphion nanum]|uniref:Uncharacterized protein n=1 Tax=Dendryphion nanum TaxID=256645 RepID=A0A9P9IE91_9PLEO|nr:hypothetical protein B0J11DRAFT_584301 [Dendryphion nanum]
MRLYTGSYLLGALYFLDSLPQSFATSNLNHDGVLLEFRIRKPFATNEKGTDAQLLGEVTSAEILGNPELSNLIARSDTSLEQIEALIQHRSVLKRQNKDKDPPSCQRKTKCPTNAQYFDEKTQKCEPCPPGQESSKDGDKCVPKKTDDEKKEQGKCPDGKKLDPSVLGQNELTENPKCVDKVDSGCPAGQSKTTVKLSECAPDDNPDQKCTKPDTEDYREKGPDGKIRHTCRSTEKKEKAKKAAYETNRKPLVDRLTNQNVNQREKTERQRKIRARRGACLALGAMTWIPETDVSQLTDDEIAGLQEPDDTMPIPNFDLEDYMVTIRAKPNIPIVDATAGFGIGGLIKAITSGGALISKTGKAFKGAASGTSATLKNLKNKGKSPASKEAVEKASKSAVVKRIVTSETLLDCVSLASTLAIAGGLSKRAAEKETVKEFTTGELWIRINMNQEKATAPIVYPSPEDSADRTLVVVMDQNTDASKPSLIWQTTPDSYWRDNRVDYATCNSIERTTINNEATLVQVWGGCCKFYDSGNCESVNGMFLMSNREDGQLKGKDDNAISSFWCTFDLTCAGAP